MSLSETDAVSIINVLSVYIYIYIYGNLELAVHGFKQVKSEQLSVLKINQSHVFLC